MSCRISVLSWLIASLIFVFTLNSFASEEKTPVAETTSTNEILKSEPEHHQGVKRDFGFSNLLEGWLTPWKPYEETEVKAPRVPLLRIAPAFFKREVRFNYLYVDDEHHDEADVNEWGLALELPLTYRIKIDIESKLLHVNTVENQEHAGFGDTKLALRAMLLESDVFSLSTGSVINVPTGDKDRHLGEEVTTVGQQIAFWMDLGHRIGLNTFLGADVPTGGEDRKDADVDFQYGIALSKTIAINNVPLLEGITPFVELNGHKGFGLDEDEKYRVDVLPGIRWDISHELYVLQGMDIPLNGTGEYDKRVWFSIIKDF